MGQVIEIHRKRIFSLEDARELFPVIKRMTADANERVKVLGTQLSFIKDAEKKTALEEQIRTEIQEWYQKITKLGCESKGIWLVDFDSGEGYYCWHYPEDELEHFHTYTEGFQGRVKLH